MRPTQATDHHAAGSPPAVRLVAPAHSPVRVRPPAGGGDMGPRGPRGGADEVRAADRDVRAAVSRVLDEVLADRVERSRAVDPVFADDIALRVARFTRQGGKRVRSRLLWWALRACGGGDGVSAAAALRLGAALELLQTCALVQDDMMDRSPLRRGRPALHADVSAQYGAAAEPGRAARFADAAAVLAGDLALAWADDLVAETVLPAGTEQRVRRLWSDLRTEMVAGQYLDVQGQITASRSLPRALRSACLKSALYSVERPLALGAALAGADDTTTAGLCSAGHCIGMAFQLRDDVNDIFADEPGRTAGGDDRERAGCAEDEERQWAGGTTGEGLREEPGHTVGGSDRERLGSADGDSAAAEGLRQEPGRTVGNDRHPAGCAADGDEREWGRRAAGGDLREGKATYLVALARDRAVAAGDRAALAVLDRSLGNGGLTEADLDAVRDTLRRTGARAAVETKIGRLIEQGLRRFDDTPLDPEGARRLRELLVAAAGAEPSRPSGRKGGADPAPGVPLCLVASVREGSRP
ncbi:polyprenyl synthetase family protein [Streptomyces sp. NPDC040750]|uniref:polyprenyl synthetase family protein n=1 Tax=Streptomyces sp. NPDC040750 TaxID=3154491 RepID=UPI0033F8FF86